MAIPFKLAFTTTHAAKYAVENWHYSRCLPAAALVKIGVWENEKFIGCIIYSNGANPQLAHPFGLEKNEVCELTRVALNTHKNPVSKFLSVSLRMMKKLNPSLKLIISYADPDQDHHGGIYQATNWIYLGKTKGAFHYKSDKGFSIHSKSMYKGFGKSNEGTKEKINLLLDQGKIERHKTFKHKYVYPLTKEIRKHLETQSKAYPMRISYNSNTPENQSGNGVQLDLSAQLS